MNVIIVGASGHGKVIADIVINCGDKVVGFLDDDQSKKEFCGYKVLGTSDTFNNYPDCEFVIAIGNADIREKIAEKMNGVNWYTAIHPKSVISKFDTVIGEGTVVMANAVINPGAKIGRHCIINTASVIEHDNVIEDFAHVAVGAKLAGEVHVGKRTWVGIGASVVQCTKVCDDCMIGAGAIVVKDIKEAGTYVGVPAVIVKK